MIYVSPKERAPASCVPLGMDLEDCSERRCCKLRVTWDLTWAKARYIELFDVEMSFDGGGWTTLSAGDAG